MKTIIPDWDQASLLPLELRDQDKLDSFSSAVNQIHLYSKMRPVYHANKNLDLTLEYSIVATFSTYTQTQRTCVTDLYKAAWYSAEFPSSFHRVGTPHPQHENISFFVSVHPYRKFGCMDSIGTTLLVQSMHSGWILVLQTHLVRDCAQEMHWVLIVVVVVVVRFGEVELSLRSTIVVVAIVVVVVA